MPEVAGRPLVSCRLYLEFPSNEHTKKVHSSVELENAGYVDSWVDGTFIVADIQAESLKSLLHTLDDFLACTGVADKVLSKPSQGNPSL